MDFWPPHLEGCICEHYRVSNLDEVAVWHSFARKGFVRLFGQFFAGLLTLRFHLGCVLFGTVLLSGKATCGFLPPCFEECIYKQHRVLIIFSFILFISAALIRHYSRGVYANTWIQFINHMGKKRRGWGTQIGTRTRQMHKQCHCWMKSAVWQVCLKTLHLAFWPICCCATSINKRHVSILDVCCLAVLLFNKATFGFLANVLLGYLLGGGLYECISTCGSTAACAHKANFTFPD